MDYRTKINCGALFGIVVTLMLSFLAYALFRRDHLIGGTIETILAIICVGVTYSGYKEMK